MLGLWVVIILLMMGGFFRGGLVGLIVGGVLGGSLVVYSSFVFVSVFNVLMFFRVE